MFTVCPKCALTLAVTAADLRAGQGYVRCGRCANVFNALLGLSEESGGGSAKNAAAAGAAGDAAAPAKVTSASVAQAPRAPQTAAPAASGAPPAVSQPAPAAAPAALRLIDSPPRPLPPSNSLASDTTEVEEFRGTGTFETIVLEGDTFLQTEEMVPEEAFDDEVAAVSRRLAAGHDETDEEIIDFSDASLKISAVLPPGKRVTPVDAPAEHPSYEAGQHLSAAATPETPAAAAAAALDHFAPARATLNWWHTAAIPLCALLLAGQAIHHWRNDLATHQALNAPLDRLYTALHRPLTPNWNLAAYDVRQLGASSDVSNQHLVRVRLSLSNHAPVPQAVPLLRVTLLDRYGKSVNSGELTPAQYLPAALRTRRLLDAEQRIDTEVSVTDPTQQASSFELDVCIAAAGGGLRCAGDGAILAANGVSP
jgi:predicted Zn finger-like uncharacterized protein